MRKNLFGWVIVAAALAFAAQAKAATEPLTVPAPAVTAPAQPGCGTVLELKLATPTQGETCPAAQPASAAPEFMAPTLRRTCRCSCGFPCTTNADCGPGGVCTAGITCC